MSDSIGPQVSSDIFWPSMLGMENHSYAIVLDVPHYSLSYAIDVVSIHPIIGCELWIGALLAVLYRGVCSKDAIVVMLFLDYDAI